MKQKNAFFRFLSISLVSLLTIVVIVFIYITVCIGSATLNDFQPEEVIPVKISHDVSSKYVSNDTMQILNWNIGYAGLGSTSNFFYDDNRFFTSGGKMIRSSKDQVEKNLRGIQSQLEKLSQVDFITLQEVDRSSKRSYYTDQLIELSNVLTGKCYQFATNYNVDRVPLPLLEFWHVLGQIRSGLATFGDHQPSSSIRYQFPGKYSWPNRIFHLDRCMLVNRYPIDSSDKEFILINTHNSAYDGGVLKKNEMAYLKTFIQQEYQHGNYVVIAGDWNQFPVGIHIDTFYQNIGMAFDSSYFPGQIEEQFIPEDWQWIYDPTFPTNRKLKDVYQDDKTPITLIDFFLCSPNVQVLEVQGIPDLFKHSDHQPILMTFQLHL